MKFNEAINTIAEELLPVEARGRRPNPEFQKWKEENPGVPTYKFFKMQRDKKAGSVSASEPSSIAIPELPGPGSVSTPKYKELPDTLATKAKIAEIYLADPEVSDDDVISRIMADAEAGELLNTDIDMIKQELAAVRASNGSTTSDLNLGADDERRMERHAAIRAAMARRGMKTGDPEKLLGKKKFAMRGRPKSNEPEPELDMPAGDDDVERLRARRPTDFED